MGPNARSKSYDRRLAPSGRLACRFSPRQSRRSSYLMLAVAAWITGCAAATTFPAPEVKKMDKHRGIADAVQVSALKTRMVVVPSWAGRISLLDFGWGNILHNDPKVDGKVLKADQAWGPWDGNATDVVRGVVGKGSKNQFKGLWLHPWTKIGAPDGRWNVEIASDVSPDAGLSAKRAYRFPYGGSLLEYVFTITNESAEAAEWTIWERAMVKAGDYCLAPAAKEGAYPKGWKVRDQTKSVPADNAETVGDFIVLKAGHKGAALAARLRDGWIATVYGRNVFLMTWKLDRDGTYPHYDGANSVFWISQDYIEIEPISPTMKLAKGKGMSFRQTWRALKLPESVDPADVRAVGKWLAENAKPSDP